jgi:CheY-like chemotaxis protein/anti-sigma regulatory factor (Ser/Thr protein kinase)
MDIAEAIAVAIETSRPLLDAHRQELRVTLPSTAAAVLGDQVRLAQAVANLLNNASKYSPRGAVIAIAAEQVDDDVVIRVSDSGAGIAADLLPRIFDPFVQADHSLERSQGGLGIGLTLVRKIVELHGGSIAATSAGAGQGSEFAIRLPAVSHEPAAAGAPPALGTTAHMPLRVLVVDDNVDAADTLAMLLEVSGHHVLTAHDGMAAIRQVDGWPPDVVVLDIGLPGMSGYEVAAQLRQRGEACPGLIAVTGYGQEADARRAIQAGFEYHMTKPVDAAELMAAITRCAAARRARASGLV